MRINGTIHNFLHWLSRLQGVVVMILLVTIGLNVVFIMETGRRLKYQQQQLEQQYSAFLPTAVAAVSGKKSFLQFLYTFVLVWFHVNCFMSLINGGKSWNSGCLSWTQLQWNSHLKRLKVSLPFGWEYDKSYIYGWKYLLTDWVYEINFDSGSFLFGA